MVLELLFNPKKAERKPHEMFFVGLLYSSIAIIITLALFKSCSSYIIIFLTVLSSLPLIAGAIQLEEIRDIRIGKEKIILKKHARILSFFVFLFLGFTLSFVIWYLILPQEISSNIFSIQINAISSINYKIITGNVVSDSTIFSKIFINNIKVFIFSIAFAFFYGAGAIFILTWNASTLAVAIGNFIGRNIGLISYPLALIKYLSHGIPEILAYFMGGLAGGIISIAVIKHDYKNKRFKSILIDSIDLIIIAILLLLLAAFIEVFISSRI